MEGDFRNKMYIGGGRGGTIPTPKNLHQYNFEKTFKLYDIVKGCY